MHSGHTPTAQAGDGRDHNPHGFTIWMVGGGVKGGIAHRSTHDYGYFALENKVHINDLHATLLHLLGLNHEKLTYQYAGRDFSADGCCGRGGEGDYRVNAENVTRPHGIIVLNHRCRFGAGREAAERRLLLFGALR